jgi:hypothetical protein
MTHAFDRRSFLRAVAAAGAGSLAALDPTATWAVGVEIARDAGFTQVVHRGQAIASPGGSVSLASRSRSRPNSR